MNKIYYKSDFCKHCEAHYTEGCDCFEAYDDPDESEEKWPSI